MDITEVRIRRVNGEGKLKGYVTVTLEQCFVIHNVKIIEGKAGLFIAMPSRKTRTGEYKDIVHPICPDFRAKMQAAIIEAWERNEPSDDTVPVD